MKRLLCAYRNASLRVKLSLLVTAVLLAFAYYAKPRQKAQLSYRDAFLIGVAQAVAVQPIGG